MYRLAMILMKGKSGASKNIRDGIKWLKLSAKYATAEHPLGLYELAMLHDEGVSNFVWTDHKYLVQLLVEAASLGHVDSMYKLGQAYADGHFKTSPDPLRGVHYYSMAADLNHYGVFLIVFID